MWSSDVQRPAGAGQAPPVDALHAHGLLRRQHEVPVIVRGEGCYVYDEHGKRYLDGLSALYCVNIGHGRAELGQAAAEQTERAAASTRTGATPTRARSSWPRAIAELAPGNLNRVFFTSGGSEAVESAWKLAKAYHARAGEPTRAQADLAQARLPRHLDGGADGDRPARRCATPFEPLTPGGHPRAEHELLPLAARIASRCGRPTRSRRRSCSRAPRRSRR